MIMVLLPSPWDVQTSLRDFGLTPNRAQSAVEDDRARNSHDGPIDFLDFLPPTLQFGRPSGANWVYFGDTPEFRRYGFEPPVLQWNMFHFTEDF